MTKLEEDEYLQRIAELEFELEELHETTSAERKHAFELENKDKLQWWRT